VLGSFGNVKLGCSGVFMIVCLFVLLVVLLLSGGGGKVEQEEGEERGGVLGHLKSLRTLCTY